MVDTLSLLTDKPQCQLRQEVHDFCLVTEGLTWPMVQRWLENMVTTGADLMEHYLDVSSTVNGLFVWLTLVLTRLYLNVVHQSQAWTACVTDVVNMMDGAIVFTEGCYLVAKSMSPVVPKDLKLDLEDPSQIKYGMVSHLLVLNDPVKDVHMRCADLDLEPRGEARPLHHLLAELFCLNPTQYRVLLVSWIHKFSMHLDTAYDWWAACGQTMSDYISYLNRDGLADGLEVFLVALSLDLNINVVQESLVWAVHRTGIDFHDPTIVWTSAGAITCYFSSCDGVDVDLDMSELQLSTSSNNFILPSLLDRPIGGQLLSAPAEYPEEDSSSMEMDPDELLECSDVPERDHARSGGRALPQLCCVCRVGLRSKTVLVSHLKLFHPAARPYSCPYCDSAFNNAPDLSSHISNLHQAKKVKCKHCEY